MALVVHVSVKYVPHLIGGQGSKANVEEYDYDCSKPMQDHVEILHARLGVEESDASKFCLQLESGKSYMSDEQPPEGLEAILRGEEKAPVILLVMRPDIVAEQALEGLKSGDNKLMKKAVFLLKSTLREDAVFAEEFMEVGGLSALLGVVMGAEQMGTRSYALGALRACMSYRSGMEEIMSSDELVESLVGVLYVNHITVRRDALEMLFVMSSLAGVGEGFRIIHNAVVRNAESQGKKPYETLISLLGSPDMDTQLNALTMCNVLLSNSPEEEEIQELVKQWKALDIVNILMRHDNVEDVAFRTQRTMFETTTGLYIGGGVADMEVDSLKRAVRQYQLQQPMNRLIQMELQEMTDVLVETARQGANVSAYAPIHRFVEQKMASRRKFVDLSPLLIKEEWVPGKESRAAIAELELCVEEQETKCAKLQGTVKEATAARSAALKRVMDAESAKSRLVAEMDARSREVAKAQQVCRKAEAAATAAKHRIKELEGDLKALKAQKSSVVGGGDSFAALAALQSQLQAAQAKLKDAEAKIKELEARPAVSQVLPPPPPPGSLPSPMGLPVAGGPSLPVTGGPPLPVTGGPSLPVTGGPSLPVGGGPPPPPMGGGPPPPPPMGGPPGPPPPPGMGGPPPPPGGGPGGWNKLRRELIKPKEKMRTIYWKRLLLPATGASKPSVWEGIDDIVGSVVGEDAIVGAFAMKKSDQKPASKSGPTEKSKKKQFTRCLDPKRSNEIGIMLASLPSVDEAVKALLTMNGKVLNRDNVNRLAASGPTTEEVEMVEAAVAGAPPDQPLDKPESFVVAFGKVKRVKDRLKMWKIKLGFEEAAGEIRVPLEKLRTACLELRDSLTLKLLLGIALHFGNYMNGGTRRGQADGFDIGFMPKLADTKDNEKRSLLYHMVLHARKRQLAKTSSKDLSLESELSMVRGAVRVDINDVGKGLTRVERDIQWTVETAKQFDGSDAVAKSILPFAEKGSKEMEGLRKEYNAALEDFASALEYFGKPRTAKMEPNEFFALFVWLMDNVKGEVKKLEASEKKQQTRGRRGTRRGMQKKPQMIGAGGGEGDPMAALAAAIKGGKGLGLKKMVRGMSSAKKGPPMGAVNPFAGIKLKKTGAKMPP